MSVSMIPTVDSGLAAKACDRRDENVDFPTPPLPESTSILCFMPARRAVMMGMSGSGPFGAEAHMDWLGHPLQASPWPACSDSGPGQCSVVVSILIQDFVLDVPGSGATRVGFSFNGASNAASGASKYGAMQGSKEVDSLGKSTVKQVVGRNQQHRQSQVQIKRKMVALVRYDGTAIGL